jgi:hypothetical protein
MELTAAETDLFAAYYRSLIPLDGDRRTARLLGDTVRGIVASESLCCSRIAAGSGCDLQHRRRVRRHRSLGYDPDIRGAPGKSR